MGFGCYFQTPNQNLFPEEAGLESIPQVSEIQTCQDMPKLIDTDCSTQGRLGVFRTGWLPMAYYAIKALPTRGATLP